MGVKARYHNNRILNHTVYFEVFESDAINFVDFMSLIGNETGIVGFDLNDFKESISGCDTVYFRTHSGDDITRIADELCGVLPKGNKALCVISAKRLPQCEDEDANEIALSVKKVRDAINPDDFFWNIYETEQKSDYKIYVLSAV